MRGRIAQCQLPAADGGPTLTGLMCAAATPSMLVTAADADARQVAPPGAALCCSLRSRTCWPLPPSPLPRWYRVPSMMMSPPDASGRPGRDVGAGLWAGGWMPVDRPAIPASGRCPGPLPVSHVELRPIGSSLPLGYLWFGVGMVLLAGTARGWQNRVDAVVARDIRATMILEDVWKDTPENSKNTKVIGQFDRCPPAVLITGRSLDGATRRLLRDRLLPYIPDWDSVYGAFRPYSHADIQTFVHYMRGLPADVLSA